MKHSIEILTAIKIIINENFMQTLFQLLVNNPQIQVFKKIINVFKKMLNTSDHAKLFTNVIFKNAILPDAIPENDLNFLRNIVDYLYS